MSPTNSIVHLEHCCGLAIALYAMTGARRVWCWPSHLQHPAKQPSIRSTLAIDSMQGEAVTMSTCLDGMQPGLQQHYACA